MMKSQPFGDVEGSPITVTKQLLEEIGKEIMALYVTRSQGAVLVLLGSLCISALWALPLTDVLCSVQKL